MLGKGPGLYERIIAPLFFNRYGLRQPVEWLMNQEHHLVYAQDGRGKLRCLYFINTTNNGCPLQRHPTVLMLNEAAKGLADGVSVNGNDSQVHILPIACGANCKEVGQLETNRQLVLQGMRDGARRVFELFLPAMLAWKVEAGASRVDVMGAASTTELGLESTNIDSLIDSLVNTIFPLSILDNPTKLEQYTTSVTLVRGIRNTDGTEHEQ